MKYRVVAPNLSLGLLLILQLLFLGLDGLQFLALVLSLFIRSKPSSGAESGLAFMPLLP
jgi:hypothetical protein